MAVRRSVMAGLASLTVLLFAGCSGEPGPEADGTIVDVADALPIRVIVRPNPAAADPDASLQLRTVPVGDGTPEVVHEQAMSTRDVKVDVDVRGMDALDVLINADLAVTIPRSFWEDITRGRLIIRVRPGGILLEQSGERWHFPHPVWETVDPATVEVVLRVGEIDPERDVPIELRAGDPAGPVLAKSSTAMIGKRWKQTVQLETESALIAVFGDHFVELPPHLWQLAWDSVLIDLRDGDATYTYTWPFSPSEVDTVHEPLVLERLP